MDLLAPKGLIPPVPKKQKKKLVTIFRRFFSSLEWGGKENKFKIPLMTFQISINNLVLYYLIVKKINDVKNLSDISEEYDAENYRQ